MTDVLASQLSARHAKEVREFERRELAPMIKVYRQARLEIRGRLATAKAETFTAQQYRVTLAQIERGLAELEARLMERGAAAISRALEVGVGHTLAEIAFWEGERGFALGAHGRIQSDALRRVTKDLLLNAYESSVRSYSSSLRGEVQRRLGAHIAMRSRWEAMSEDIAGRLKTNAISGSRWKAERIVRTELHRALNAGNQAGLEEAAVRLPGLKRQWDAALDARTSRICRHLNGEVRGLDETWTHDGRTYTRPPAHPNCRSRIVPWRAAWERRRSG